jgi:hypothetical protein
MRSDLITKILKETPLEIRLKVSNEMAFIHLITELGYRENKAWDETDDKDNEILNKLMKLAKEHTEHQMKTIEKWKDDTTLIEYSEKESFPFTVEPVAYTERTILPFCNSSGECDETCERCHPKNGVQHTERTTLPTCNSSGACDETCERCYPKTNDNDIK